MIDFRKTTESLTNLLEELESSPLVSEMKVNLYLKNGSVVEVKMDLQELNRLIEPPVILKIV